MISYAKRKVFSQGEIDLYERAVELVGRVSDRWGSELRCHEIARAVQSAFLTAYPLLSTHHVRVVDGRCSGVEHSWIRLHLSSLRFSILDVYAPGCVPQVLLVDLLVSRHYVDGDERTDINHQTIGLLLEEMRH